MSSFLKIFFKSKGQRFNMKGKLDIFHNVQMTCCKEITIKESVVNNR